MLSHTRKVFRKLPYNCFETVFLRTCQKVCYDDASPYVPFPLVFSEIIHPLKDVSLGICFPLTMHPLDNAALTDVSRLWIAYRRWIIITATYYRNILHLRKLLLNKQLFDLLKIRDVVLGEKIPHLHKKSGK